MLTHVKPIKTRIEKTLNSRLYTVTGVQTCALPISYAIFYCCKNLEFLLSNRTFTILTDHSNLLHLKESTNVVIQRWSLALSELDYNLRFIAGSKNIIADSMSSDF